MNTSNLALRNIRLLKWQGFFAAFRIFIAIQYIYYASKSLDNSQIAFIVSAFFLGMLTVNVPSGGFADRYGTKKGIITSSLLLTSSYLLFSFAESLPLFIVANFLQGAGVAFGSGSDETLLFNSLNSISKKEEFSKHFGTIWAYSMFGFAVSSVVASMLNPSNYRYAFALSALGGLTSLIAAMQLWEAPKASASSAQHSLLGHLRNGALAIRSSEFLVCLISYILFMTMTIQIFFQYIQISLAQAGILINYFGITYASFVLLCGLASKVTHRLEGRFGPKKLLATFLLCICVGYAGTALSTTAWTCLVFILLVEFVFGSMIPVVQSIFHSALTSESRASAASFRSCLVDISIIMAAPIFGGIADVAGVSKMLLILSGVAIVGAGLSLLRLYRHLGGGATQANK